MMRGSLILPVTSPPEDALTFERSFELTAAILVCILHFLVTTLSFVNRLDGCVMLPASQMWMNAVSSCAHAQTARRSSAPPIKSQHWWIQWSKFRPISFLMQFSSKILLNNKFSLPHQGLTPCHPTPHVWEILNPPLVSRNKFYWRLLEGSFKHNEI